MGEIEEQDKTYGEDERLRFLRTVCDSGMSSKAFT